MSNAAFRDNIHAVISAKAPSLSHATQISLPCMLHTQAWSAQQLQKDLGFAPDQAKQLSEWSHGLDSSPVAERPPPKTLSIQMTLTPIPLAMHPSMGRDIAVAGGKAGKYGVLLRWVFNQGCQAWRPVRYR